MVVEIGCLSASTGSSAGASAAPDALPPPAGGSSERLSPKAVTSGSMPTGWCATLALRHSSKAYLTCPY